jgi:hypothetical protein
VLLFEAAVEVSVNTTVEVLRLLSRRETAVEVSRPLLKCRGCCRSGGAVVEVFEAAVEVSRPPSRRCQYRGCNAVNSP